jgi:hypothetical protein
VDRGKLREEWSGIEVITRRYRVPLRHRVRLVLIVVGDRRLRRDALDHWSSLASSNLPRPSLGHPLVATDSTSIVVLQVASRSGTWKNVESMMRSGERLKTKRCLKWEGSWSESGNG